MLIFSYHHTIWQVTAFNIWHLKSSANSWQSLGYWHVVLHSKWPSHGLLSELSVGDVSVQLASSRLTVGRRELWNKGHSVSPCIRCCEIIVMSRIRNFCARKPCRQRWQKKYQWASGSPRTRWMTSGLSRCRSNEVCATSQSFSNGVAKHCLHCTHFPCIHLLHLQHGMMLSRKGCCELRKCYDFQGILRVKGMY